MTINQPTDQEVKNLVLLTNNALTEDEARKHLIETRTALAQVAQEKADRDAAITQAVAGAMPGLVDLGEAMGAADKALGVVTTAVSGFEATSAEAKVASAKLTKAMAKVKEAAQPPAAAEPAPATAAE